MTSKPEMTETVKSGSEREIYPQMLINEKPIKFHIDCSVTVNVLPSKYVNKEDIQPTKRVLQMWNKTELKPEGICCVTIRNSRNQKKYSVEFIIVKEYLTPLLGAAVIQQMGLIEVHKETPYMGHLVTADGLRPDPEKIEAVHNMPKPDNVKAVRRFCGFVNYLAKFLPRLAEVLEPIQQLTRKDVPWQWQHECEAAFEKVKELVTEAPLLKYYNPGEELTVQCDASEKGLGAALMQNGQPIAFASRALTDPETRYAQIEKEMLAVVFALQKFDQYVYGCSVTVQSDHKPLAAISNKPLRSAPKRLQGMLLKIQKYDVTIVYKPGPEMYLADTLSRAFLPTTKNTQGEFERVNAVKLLPMTDERLEEIRTSTRDDDMLQQLKEVIQIGWPEEKQELPAVLAPYFSFRDEMSVYDGLIFKGEPSQLTHRRKWLFEES